MKNLIQSSRRRFLAQLSVLSAVPLFGSGSDLFAANSQKQSFKFGYATITWGNDIARAIREISSLGFTGVQLKNPFAEYGQKPEVLRQLLEDAKLDVVMLSSGNVKLNTGDDEAVITQHVNNAKFIKALGGKRIQVLNSSRPANGQINPEDLIKSGKILTAIGKRTAEIGIETTVHNHMNQLGETPEEMDTILNAMDPKYVGLLLDVAHYQQGGGDPVAAIRKYKSMIKVLHLKDVKNNENGKGYQFVELGQGRVNFPAVMGALKAINFTGYNIVELDAVPVKGRTEIESAKISKDYIVNKLGVKI